MMLQLIALALALPGAAWAIREIAEILRPVGPSKRKAYVRRSRATRTQERNTVTDKITTGLAVCLTGTATLLIVTSLTAPSTWLVIALSVVMAIEAVAIALRIRDRYV